MVASSTPKHRLILTDTVYAFSPNRDTLGGTAYLLQHRDDTGQAANILIDAPPWTEATEAFLKEQGVRWFFITHRDGLGQAATIQPALGCELVIQEQEAYLLPQTPRQAFRHRFDFDSTAWALWTPGYSPGSSCLYTSVAGGILFSGRHLLPDPQGQVGPQRTTKTFHWPRQLRQVQRLRQEFSPETLKYLCPGANTGFLRGRRIVEDAYSRL